jgi:hypothetical protein
MVFHGRRPISSDVEDTIFACRRCGAELIRTSMRKPAMAESEKSKSAEAA